MTVEANKSIKNDNKDVNMSDYDLECALWADTPVSAWSDSITEQVRLPCGYFFFAFDMI